MKIGIDIDATMNTAYFDNILYAQMFCKDNNISYTFDDTKPSVKDQFQLTNVAYGQFMTRYFPLIVQDSRPLSYCKETIDTILKCGHEVYCITSRDSFYDNPSHLYTGEEMMHDTLTWFQRYNLPFDSSNTFFSVSNKGEFCKRNNVDILIDDNPKHIRECIENEITCLFPLYKYNCEFINISNYAVALIGGWNSFRVILESTYN